MIDVQTVSIAVAAASVVAGVIYYSLQIRHQTKQRQTDLIMRLRSDWRSRELREAYLRVVNLNFTDYDEYARKYPLWEGTEAPEPQAIGDICKFFDDIGILLHRKLMDTGMVDELFGFWVKTTWEKVKFVIEGRRKEINQPAIYKWFEYLYNEMKKREPDASAIKA